MKKSMNKLAVVVVLLMFGSLPALAIIDKIEVNQFSPGFKEYQSTDTIPVPQGRERYFRVHGGGTDLATEVEAGSGIDCPIVGRKRGIGSYVDFRCTVSDSASSTARTVRIKYPAGEDTFRIEVMKVGTISKIEYEPNINTTNLGITSSAGLTSGMPTAGMSSVSASGVSSRRAAVNLPKNEDITLVVTGTKLSNVILYTRRSNGYFDGEVLPGATDTECKIRIKFTSGTTHRILLVDREATDKIVPIEFFHYKGSPTNTRLDVTTVSTAGTGGSVSSVGVTNGIVRGGTTSAQQFTDVAPRANMINVFRRLSNFAPFAIGGVTFLTVDNQYCQGMSPNQSKEITVPDLTWGVTNVGTQSINQPFQIVLRGTGGTQLATETVNSLAPGATQNFTFRRDRSVVRVKTRSDRQGCFVSPSDAPDFFFEDGAFSVLVDSTAVLGEDSSRRANNTRNY